MPVADTWYKTVKEPDGSTRKVKSAAYGRGRRWAARYWDDRGEQKSPKFKTKPAAERHLKAVEGDLARGQYVDPKAGAVTLRDFAADWLAAQTFEESTRQQMELRFRLHVYPQLGDRRIGQIRPSMLQAWIRGRQEVLADSTVRTVFEGLSAVFAAAVDDEVIAKNPCRARSVKPPTPERRTILPWSLERVAAVQEALPSRYGLLVVAGAALGLRQGEAFGLSPDDLDMARQTVRVRRQVKIVNNVLCFAPPKGGKEREVPLPATAALQFAAYLEEWPAHSVTLPWRHSQGEPVTTSLVFTSREHKALNKNYINDRIWKPALVAAGVIPKREKGKRFAASRANGFHALRHHYASVALDAGVSIKALAEYLGHADPGFTLRTYVHMMPSSGDRMREAIDRAWAANGLS